jgi:hypothetical protein
VTFNQLSPTEWETERGDVDFHIRLEQDNYVIDVFDSCHPDANEAAGGKDEGKGMRDESGLRRTRAESGTAASTMA